jgi:hypothetical protein
LSYSECAQRARKATDDVFLLEKRITRIVEIVGEVYNSDAYIAELDLPGGIRDNVIILEAKLAGGGFETKPEIEEFRYMPIAMLDMEDSAIYKLFVKRKMEQAELNETALAKTAATRKLAYSAMLKLTAEELDALGVEKFSE